MAALGGAAADASPLLRADEQAAAGLRGTAPPEAASATTQALPLSAWAIHDADPPAARPAKADPLLDEGAYASYQGGAGALAAAPAPSAPPAADAGPYVAGQPLPGAPASGAFYPQPNSAAAAAPLSGGPQLEAPALGCWGAASLLFNAAVLALLLCVALDAGGARQALGAAAGLAYLVYLALCLCSPSAKALRNCMGAAALQAHTAAVRAARPEVWAQVVCWHNETRTRHVTETGKDGKRHSRRETYTVRVETHRARGAWGYRGVRDISGEPVHQPYLPMLEVHYKPVQDFLDQQSYLAWRGWRESFFNANRRDVHQDTSSGMTIPGHIPYVMLRQSSAWWAGPGAHLLAVAAGCGMFYECLVFQRTPHARYSIVKQFYI